mgnify:CR=1 FL=1
MNILYEISQTAARFPDRTVMICKEGRLNYGDLARCTDLLAAAIQRLCKRKPNANSGLRTQESPDAHLFSCMCKIRKGLLPD